MFQNILKGAIKKNANHVLYETLCSKMIYVSFKADSKTHTVRMQGKKNAAK
jgi:hypothetical protein